MKKKTVVIIGALCIICILGGYVYGASLNSLGGVGFNNENNVATYISQTNALDDNFLLIRGTDGHYTKMMLSPNGEGESGWTTLLQLANTDFYLDQDNYEMLEITWENDYAYINVWALGTGEQRSFALMLDGTPLFALDVGRTELDQDEGEFYIWTSRPILTTHGDTSWSYPLDITDTAGKNGSAAIPFGADVSSMIGIIPEDYELAEGNNTFKVYFEALCSTSYGLIFDSRGAAATNYPTYFDTLALNKQYLEDNRIDVVVYNNSGANYTLTANWYFVLELRY